MTRVIINIHSSEGITTEVVGRGKGKLIVERTPLVGTPAGMGFGGGEMLCLAAGTCFYNNLRRLANARGINLTTIEVEVAAEWNDPSPTAREIIIKPKIEAETSDQVLRDLIQLAMHESSVANTITHSVPVKISWQEADE